MVITLLNLGVYTSAVFAVSSDSEDVYTQEYLSDLEWLTAHLLESDVSEEAVLAVLESRELGDKERLEALAELLRSSDVLIAQTQNTPPVVAPDFKVKPEKKPPLTPEEIELLKALMEACGKSGGIAWCSDEPNKKKACQYKCNEDDDS